MEKKIINIIKQFQKFEITEHMIYKTLSNKSDEKNRKLLSTISEDELSHYQILKSYSGVDIEPDRWMIFKYRIISIFLGKTFAIKLMERGEEKARENYKVLFDEISEIKNIIYDEERHEKLLIDSIDERVVRHIGSIVLGLNDAIIELTGALVGFSFAIKKPVQIGLIGIITGVAAAMSMSGSEYLSAKTENNRNPLAASFYTGITYIMVVILLDFPFFIFGNYLTALSMTIIIVISITLLFNIFISVVKDVSFKKSLIEMLAISGTVSIISFLLGTLVRKYFGVEL